MLRNGPFWVLAGAVLVLFFLPLGPFWSGPFWFAWAVFDLHWGRFVDGPIWSVPVGCQYIGLRFDSLVLLQFVWNFLLFKFVFNITFHS